MPTVTPSAPLRSPLPPTVIALGITSFFTDLGAEMIFPLLPMFVATLGANPAFIGLVEGLADAGASILKLAMGWAADKFAHKKPWVLFGYGLAAFVRPLVFFATAPWQVLAIRLTDRVGKGLRSTPRDVLLANAVSPEQSGRAFGFHRAMDHAGAVVGPIVASALLACGVPLRFVFASALVPGLCAVVAVLTVKERATARVAEKHRGTTTAGREDDAIPRSLKQYIAIICLFALGNSTDAFLLLRAHSIGISILSLPFVWSAFHVVKVVVAYFAGSWSDRLPRHRLVVAGWVTYALVYLGFAFANQTWHIWGLFLVYGAHHGLCEPAEKAMVRDLAPGSALGRAFGLYNFSVGIMALPAGLLTGWLWQTWGPVVALGAGAATAGAATVALLAWGGAQRRVISSA